MDNFKYINGKLFCENVEIDDIIDQYGTPCYIYSTKTITDHYRKFVSAFSTLDPLIAFSVKSCNNISILKTLTRLGSGMDIVSVGELYKSLKADVDPKKIVFAGVGKSAAELKVAIETGLKYINIESHEELSEVCSLAKALSKKANIAIRVNPDVFDSRTHEKTTTGNKTSKFGVSIDEIKKLFIENSDNDTVELNGLHVHIGSPIYSPEPYVKAIVKMKQLIGELSVMGIKIKSLNIGGGFAADYRDNNYLSWDDYAKDIVPALKSLRDMGIEIIMEPGRTISANSAIFACDILYRKIAGDINYIILDGGMSHFVRPALYDAKHFIAPTKFKNDITTNADQSCFRGIETERFNIAGPICESSDIFAKNCLLPASIKRGDKIAFFSAGAYGMVMASNYNAVPRAPEVLIDGDSIKLIRERESYEDLIAKEHLIS